jgi:Rieske Fe-S protein
MEGHQEPDVSVERRRLIFTGSAIAISSLVGSAPVMAGPETERPRKGDQLVAADPSEHAGKLVTLEMLRIGGGMLPAWPFDAVGNVERSQSRLNKVVLIRVDPVALDEKTRASAADGVLAFSAVCTHQGCALTGWIPDGALLACACHGSTFDVTNGGTVTGGPAKRRLAILPLRLGDGGVLLVADGFTSKLGYM